MEENKMIQVLTCECTPTKLYPSKQHYRQHLKTKRHMSWEETKRVHYLEKKIVRLENDLCHLKMECDFWKKQVFRLKKKDEIH